MLWDEPKIFFLISIHAPRAGRDAFLRSATKGGEISIHAPRAGRDPEARDSWRRGCHFNPRAPCGARQQFNDGAVVADGFQSTRPVRGAT